MTTTTLNANDLPFAGTAQIVTNIYNAVIGGVAGLRSLGQTLDTALEMRNRYNELNALSDTSLESIGLNRNAIATVVAVEAGLFTPNEIAPVASNSNDATVRAVA